MKLASSTQGLGQTPVGQIEPAGPGAARLTISGVDVVEGGSPDGVALRFKDFKENTLIEGTPDPAYAKPAPGGRIGDQVFALGSDVVNALVRNLGNNNTIYVEADSIGDVRTQVGGELTLGAAAPRPEPAQPFAQQTTAEPAAAAAQGAAAPQPAAHVKKGHGALIAIIIALLLLLAIAAFLAWWFLLRHPAADASALPDAAPQEQAAPAQDSQQPAQDQQAQNASDQQPAAQDNAAQQGGQPQQGAQDQQPQQGAQDQSAQDQDAQDQQSQGGVVDGSALQQGANGAGGQAVGGSVKGAVSGPCSVAANSNDQALLKGCLATNPSDQDLMGLAKDALSNKRCDVGTRLLTSLGRSGKQDFALYYAKLADPNTRDASACVKKDAQGARYWYQKALDAGSSDEARQALEKLK